MTKGKRFLAIFTPPTISVAALASGTLLHAAFVLTGIFGMAGFDILGSWIHDPAWQVTAIILGAVLQLSGAGLARLSFRRGLVAGDLVVDILDSLARIVVSLFGVVLTWGGIAVMGMVLAIVFFDPRALLPLSLIGVSWSAAGVLSWKASNSHPGKQ